jgi:hypothetical protein
VALLARLGQLGRFQERKGLMAEIAQQLTTLMWIQCLAALVWFFVALMAFASYRAFKQFADLGWAVTFLFLGALRLGYAWEASQA